MNQTFKNCKITATRHQYVLIINDSSMKYEIFNMDNHKLVFSDSDELVCLSLMFRFTGNEEVDYNLLKINGRSL